MIDDSSWLSYLGWNIQGGFFSWLSIRYLQRGFPSRVAASLHGIQGSKRQCSKKSPACKLLPSLFIMFADVPLAITSHMDKFTGRGQHKGVNTRSHPGPLTYEYMYIMLINTNT